MDSVQIKPLSRLLDRLSTTIDNPELQHDPHERRKLASNLENGRTLLLTLEKQASTIRVQSQRQQIQADLQSKRDTIKGLTKRLDELEQVADDDENEDEDDTEQDDAQLSYAPARTDAQDGLDTSGGGQDGGGAGEAAQQLSDTLHSELRSRRPLQASDNREAASTTARQSLFAARAQDKTQTTETMLSHNRIEQETLTTNLLGLARALKESSQNFSSGLAAEKEVLKRAEGSLESSSVGMEAAERRMGTLRRLSEGQGWWGRMKLYAIIFVLWVACILLVFVGPKIRL